MGKAPSKAKPETPVTQNAQEFIAPSNLQFDSENPRFADINFADEEEIIQYLYDHADVDELMQSILSAGYIDFEPLIVRRRDNVVLDRTLP